MRRDLRLLCLLVGVLTASHTVKGEKCSLCPNDEEITNPSARIPQLEIPGDPRPTCQDAVDFSSSINNETELCSLLQAQAGFCGCPGVDIPTESCSLCPDGNPSPNTDTRTLAGVTCGELDTYLSFLSVDDCQSAHGQALLRNAFGCGCEGATTECAMCPDGTIEMENPDSIVPFFSLITGVGNPTCQDVAVQASAASSNMIDCDLIQRQAGFCGCANVDPINECGLCPGNESPDNPNLIVPTSDTCLDLYNYMLYMDADTCATARAADIQALGFVCGCPNAEAQCSLCPNGDDPPNPDKVVEAENETCGKLAQVVAGLGEERCQDQRNTIIGITAARCDCEGASFPACSFQQNPNLCTEELLDTVPDKDCECYSFCDGEFVQCHQYPGGLLLGDQCPGVPVAGCNRATAMKNKERPTGDSVDSNVDESAACPCHAFLGRLPLFVFSSLLLTFLF